MSGIFGVLRFDGGAVLPRDIERLGAAMAERGPDGRKFSVDGEIGLGHCLARVNSEDFYETQPLIDRERGLTLVADCRLDNRDALGADFALSAAAMRDMPDSALILMAYKMWGEDCAAHLLGDFAFALWDRRARVLFLARDHMGQRAVHYYLGPAQFVFATDTRALWAHPDVPRKVNETEFARFLLRGLDAPAGATIYESVYGLPGGTTLCLSLDGMPRTRRYWQPQAAPEHLGRDEAYYLRNYCSLLEEAVACRVRRLIRPPALCFSGGFDSGTIAALAAPLLAARGQRLLAAASVSAFAAAAGAGDAHAAVEWFRGHLPNLDIRYFKRGIRDPFDNIEANFLETDQPVAVNHVYRGLYAVARDAGCRLMLDGFGGDYTLNPRAAHALGHVLRGGRPLTALREVWRAARISGLPLWDVFRSQILLPLLPPWVTNFRRALRRGHQPLWAWRGVAGDLTARVTANGALDKRRLRGNFQASGPAWSEQVLKRQAGAAAMPMANVAALYGLTLTRPFHDKRIVELALAIPEHLHFKNGRNRYLARQALAGVLPPALLAYSGNNAPDDPDGLASAIASARQAGQAAQALDADGALSRWADFGRLAEMAAAPAELGRQRNTAALRAVETLAAVRFYAWLARSNRAG